MHSPLSLVGFTLDTSLGSACLDCHIAEVCNSTIRLQMKLQASKHKGEEREDPFRKKLHLKQKHARAKGFQHFPCKNGSDLEVQKILGTGIC